MVVTRLLRGARLRRYAAGFPTYARRSATDLERDRCGALIRGSIFRGELGGLCVYGFGRADSVCSFGVNISLHFCTAGLLWVVSIWLLYCQETNLKDRKIAAYDLIAVYPVDLHVVHSLLS